MRRALGILLCLVLLCSFAGAAREDSLNGRIDSYLYTHGLGEDNFALSFFNLETAETYDFNENAFFSIGQVWTLPLHMYYCKQEYNGAFLPAYTDPNYNNPDYEYTINGMNLDTCRTNSILSGNNDVNEAMRNAVTQYKTVINEEFGHIKEADLPETFFTDDTYSTKFLINCMIELSREAEIYGDLMRLYDLAQVPEGLNAYGRPYKVLQIYGEQDDFICAIGEVTAPDPYLIACIVSKSAGGDQILAEINELICSYIEVNSEHANAQVETNNAGFERSDSNFLVADQNPNDMSAVIKWICIALGAAAVLALLLFGVNQFLTWKNRSDRER